MTNAAEAEQAAEMPIALDVLIIGGGIMGLWVLMELHEAGYAVLLIERRELGGEQTCHSHVYIHQGHLYRVIELAARLKDTQARWQVWLENHAPQRAVTPSYFGFRSDAEADLRTKLWNDERLRLPYIVVSPDTVPALMGGSIRVLLQTPEVTFDGTSLVRELSHSVEEFIGRIEAVRSIRVNTLTKEVEEVEVSMPGGGRVTFQPKVLVLASGAGNQALLENMVGDNSALRQQVRGAQQIRKSHMLVIKGAKGDLDPLTGVFPSYDGLFLVSRDLGNETVWLVSNHYGPELTSVEHWLKYDERWWLPGVWAALQEIAPRAFTHPERLQWGIYAAPKAEGRHDGRIPTEERVEPFGFANLWAVWPTKLTLAPTASHAVRNRIQQLIPRPTRWASPPAAWRTSRVPAEVAPERWLKTPLIPWDMFRRCYL